MKFLQILHVDKIVKLNTLENSVFPSKGKHEIKMQQNFYIPKLQI